MKFFRTLLCLSFIISAFSLELSAFNRRTEASEYLALLNSVGLKYGFKEAAGSDGSGEQSDFEYTLKFDGKEIGGGSTMMLNKFVTDRKVQIEIESAWFNALPKEFTSVFCPNQNYITMKLSDIDAFTFVKTAVGGEFVINYSQKDQKKSFAIVIQNAGNQADDFTVSYAQCNKQEDMFKENSKQLTLNLNKELNEIIGVINQVLDSIAAFRKEADVKQTQIKRQLDKYTKAYKKLLEDKAKLEARITEVVIRIAARQTEINGLKSDLQKTRNEMVNASIALSLFKKIANEAEAQKKRDIERITKKRQGEIEQLWYYLEAAYFYRVFPEKLIASQVDIDNAINKANMATTKAKIAKAFYPIKIEFANDPVK